MTRPGLLYSAGVVSAGLLLQGITAAAGQAPPEYAPQTVVAGADDLARVAAVIEENTKVIGRLNEKLVQTRNERDAAQADNERLRRRLDHPGGPSRDDGDQDAAQPPSEGGGSSDDSGDDGGDDGQEAAPVESDRPWPQPRADVHLLADVVCRVTVDGAQVGWTPLTVQLAPGRHAIVLGNGASCRRIVFDAPSVVSVVRTFVVTFGRPTAQRPFAAPPAAIPGYWQPRPVAIAPWVAPRVQYCGQRISTVVMRPSVQMYCRPLVRWITALGVALGPRYR